MKRALTLIVLAVALVTVMISLSFLPGAANDAVLADFTPTAFAYLPVVRRDPTPTPIPQSSVYVENDTGGQLCYEIYGSGIGRKCFSSGTHHYGSFPTGTYSWHASARCGSDGGTRYYSSGTWVHRFWCGVAGGAQSAPSLRHLEE